MRGVREIPPVADDYELVRQSLERARRIDERRPSSGSRELAIAAASCIGGGLVLVLAVYVAAWISTWPTETWRRLAAVGGVLAGLWILRRSFVGLQMIDYVPRPRPRRKPGCVHGTLYPCEHGCWACALCDCHLLPEMPAPGAPPDRGPTNRLEAYGMGRCREGLDR